MSKLIVFIEYFSFPNDLIKLFRNISKYDNVVLVLYRNLDTYSRESLSNFLTSLKPQVSVFIVDNVFDELFNYLNTDHVLDLSFMKPINVFTILLCIINKRIVRVKAKILINSLVLDSKILKLLTRFDLNKPRYRVLVSLCNEYTVESEIASFAKTTLRSVYRYLREFREYDFIKTKRGEIELTTIGKELCRIIDIVTKQHV